MCCYIGSHSETWLGFDVQQGFCPVEGLSGNKVSTRRNMMTVVQKITGLHEMTGQVVKVVMIKLGT
jgi:hypothetical protein